LVYLCGLGLAIAFWRGDKLEWVGEWDALINKLLSYWKSEKLFIFAAPPAFDLHSLDVADQGFEFVFRGFFIPFLNKLRRRRRSDGIRCSYYLWSSFRLLLALALFSQCIAEAILRFLLLSLILILH